MKNLGLVAVLLLVVAGSVLGAQALEVTIERVAFESWGYLHDSISLDLGDARKKFKGVSGVANYQVKGISGRVKVREIVWDVSSGEKPFLVEDRTISTDKKGRFSDFIVFGVVDGLPLPEGCRTREQKLLLTIAGEERLLRTVMMTVCPKSGTIELK